MREIRLALITLIAVWLEISFLGAWRPLGVIPNVFLIVVLIASMSVRASEALAMAMGGGLLLDLASGADFGLRTAFFCFLALLVVVIRRTGADFERLGMKLAAVLSATILYDTVVLATLVVHRSGINWRVAIGRIAVELALNVGLMLVSHTLLHRLFETGSSGASQEQT